MGHEELKEIGINAYGHRHKLLKGLERLLGGQQGEYACTQTHTRAHTYTHKHTHFIVKDVSHSR